MYRQRLEFPSQVWDVEYSPVVQASLDGSDTIGNEPGASVVKAMCRVSE